MIELFLVYSMWGRVRDRLYAKGYDKTLKYQVSVVLAWFAGEFLGALVYEMFVAAAAGQPNRVFLYLAALAGGAVGAGIVFLTVLKLPQLEIAGASDLVWQRRR